jgi:hypothetical protein
MRAIPVGQTGDARRVATLTAVTRLTAVMGVALAGYAMAAILTGTAALAQVSAATERTVAASSNMELAPSDISAQRRRVRRGPTRLRVYPTQTHRALGPNAVRSCEAWYEQEFRPSGTVIVPRMRCRWING